MNWTEALRLRFVLSPTLLCSRQVQIDLAVQDIETLRQEVLAARQRLDAMEAILLVSI